MARLETKKSITVLADQESYSAVSHYNLNQHSVDYIIECLYEDPSDIITSEDGYYFIDVGGYIEEKDECGTVDGGYFELFLMAYVDPDYLDLKPSLFDLTVD